MKKMFLSVAAVCISAALQAQQDSAKTLDEVIVTANRLEQKQSQTGKVVTVINKATLEKSAGKTVSQLLNEQAGITINGALNNAGSVQTVYMRGAASGRVLVLLDGIPVGDPSFINNEFDLNFLSIADIERIEIARGAQSTLYGSDAIAGVINIITIKKDAVKPLQAKSSFIAGNYGTLRQHLQLYGKKGKINYQVRYTGIGTRGFSSAYDSSRNAGFDKDGYRGHMLNGALQYHATKELLLKSFVQISRYRSDVDAGTFTDDKDFTIRNRNLITGAGFQYKKENLTITGNYQYAQNKRKFVNDSTDVSGFTQYSIDEYFSKTQFVELYASFRLSKSFTWLQGADYRYGAYNSQLLSISAFGPYTYQFTDTSVSQSSLYGSLLYNGLGGRLNLELGGRLNVHSRYGANHTYTFNPSYAINNKLRWFGSIASGFKAPGLYQLYSSYGNPLLKPEESTNYETGVEYSKAPLRMRGVFFYRTTKNGMDFDYNNYVYINLLRQIVRGVEYEVTWQFNSRFNVTGNYTYLSGTEQTQSRESFKDTAYTYLLRRPAHTLNLSVGYTQKRFSASVTGRYVSRRYDVGGYASRDISLDAYVLLNAYAEYHYGKRVKLFVDLQNLTNRRFFDLRGFNSIPFMISGGVTVHL